MGLLWAGVAQAGVSMPEAAQAGRSEAAARLGAEMARSFEAPVLAELTSHALAQGWTRARTRPALSDLRSDVAADFRADRTVMLHSVRFSRTEAAWLLAAEDI